MSTFAVEVVRLDDVLPHENADKLELAVIGGYRAVVAKGLHRRGDRVVYVPEDSIVPDDVLEAFGFTGKLGGKAKNRVKAIRLRGELSQGLVLPCDDVAEFLLEQGKIGYTEEFYEGKDMTDLLGIEKYEEPIPVEMAGKQRPRPSWFPMYTDIENIKKYNRVLEDGEEVIVTEKLHGTNFGAGMHVDDRTMRVSSRRVVLEEDEANLYWRAARQATLDTTLDRILTFTGCQSAVIFGEVVGPGVQDLTYGVSNGEIGFRWFDLMLDGGYVNEDDARDIIERTHPRFERVPVLYRGPYSLEKIQELTDGKDFSGSHIREGVVVKPVMERRTKMGRVILKSISAEYLLRAGPTTERH